MDRLEEELNKPSNVDQNYIEALEKNYQAEMQQMNDRYTTITITNKQEVDKLKQKINYLENLLSSEKQNWIEKIKHLTELLNNEKKNQQQ